MNLGLVYQLQDHISEAMTEFRRALKIKPKLAGANFFLGVDYCKLGEGTKAMPYLKAAVHEEPKQPGIRSWLATAQEMSGDIHAEVATIREALSLQPQDVDLLYLLGHAYERLGKEDAGRLQNAAPGSARAEQLLAESYATGREWPTAVLHYQNALAAAPATPELHAELGEVLLRAGRIDRAAREFEEELRLHPGDSRATMRRGEVKLLRGDLDGALQDWTQAMDTDEPQAEKVFGIRERGLADANFEQLPEPLKQKIEQFAPELRKKDIPAAHLALAFLAVQNGDAAAAGAESARATSSGTGTHATSSCSEAEVRQSLQEGHLSDVARCGVPVLTPHSPPDLRIGVAGALFESGEYEPALNVLSGLPSRKQNSPEASYWRARCYEQLATAAYIKLSEVDANSYRMHQLLGDLDVARGNDGKAIEEYRLAIAAKPALPNLHYSLGHILWKDLKVPEAREEFQAELGLNSRHAAALNELGDTYLLEHQPEKALPYLVRALRLDPGNPDIHRDLGTAYTELRDYPKAEAQFKIAVTADHDGAVHYKLARVYQSLGEKEKAAREFELSTTLNREAQSKLEKQTERLVDVEKSTQNP
jgi:tetratricopeptide (TPR) repeat protein